MTDGSDDMARLAARSPVGLTAAALNEVEAALLKRDVAMMRGMRGEVAPIERRAAWAACVALDSAVEYLDGELELLQADLQATGAGDRGLHEVYNAAEAAARSEMPSAPVAASNAQFVVVESKLLQLAGLAEALADRHVRGALAAFRTEDWSYDLGNHSYHEAVMRRLRRGRDAVCTFAEDADREDETGREAAESRKHLRLVSRVLGGVLITGANAAATVMLGPVAAAASTVIGAAATSVLDIAANPEAD